MKKHTLVLLASLVFIFSTAHAQKKISALFLGNSYTQYNNLPNLVAQLALAGGDTLEFDSNTPGGYTMMGHSTNATSIAKINSRSWDFVVLQEQSQIPSFSPAQVATDFYPHARAVNNLIKANDSCTTTMFYMTWGRKNGDASNCAVYPPVCTYWGMQRRLRHSYLEIGDELNAMVAPVGLAWKESRKIDSTYNLYTGDNSHPNASGSYLAACVFYAMIFEKSPAGSTYTFSLSASNAMYLQNIAEQIVFDSLETWNIWDVYVQAGNAHTVVGDTAYFIQTSRNATWHSWDFGDGNTSSTPGPMHVYDTSGTYYVTYVAGNNCHTDTLFDTVEIAPRATPPPTPTPNSIDNIGDSKPVLQRTHLRSGEWLSFDPDILPQIDRVEIWDASGKRTASYSDPSAIRAPQASGLYIVVIGKNDGSANRERIIVSSD